jgi:hypothetical protein
MQALERDPTWRINLDFVMFNVLPAVLQLELFTSNGLMIQSKGSGKVLFGYFPVLVNS